MNFNNNNNIKKIITFLLMLIKINIIFIFQIISKIIIQSFIIIINIKIFNIIHIN
jgi:hypothetical protein